MVGGKAVGDQGTAPKKVIFLEGEKSKTFAKTPTQFMSLIPTVYNADTLGIRPDLIKRPIDSWAELLNPEFKGKAAILNIPSIGIMDAAMVVEAKGLYKYPDKGNMTKKEIDLTIKTLDRGQEGGPVPLALEGLQRERQPDGLGRGRDPVDVVAGRHRRAREGHSVHLPAAEGRLSRLGGSGFGLPSTLSGKKLDAAYVFINWFLDGWAGAYLNRQGYYSRRARDREVEDGGLRVGLLDGRQARDARHQVARTATCWPRPAASRDGGSYEQRMGGIACWNALMDENTYMVQKWNEFVAA